MEIRLANEHDWQGIWEILRVVFATGDSFPQEPGTTPAVAQTYWMETPPLTYVAVVDGEIVGSYYLKPNQVGLGAHVANAGYVVKPGSRGRGIGKKMGLHSMAEAQRHGFKAMQFNLVVSTNIPSIKLWKSLGFTMVGTLPNAFDHSEHGYVDAYVFYRELKDDFFK